MRYFAHKATVGVAVIAMVAVVTGCGPRAGHLASPGVALSGDTDPLKSRWDDPRPEREITVPVGSPESVRLPAEAAPARKRRVRAEFMNSSQVAAYLKRGGRMAVLPVGGVAATGPDIPLGATGLNVHATAVMLAERWDALAFPPIPYSWTGDAGGLPGTVGVSIEETMDYARACIDSLFECGFERIVLLGDDSTFLQLYSLCSTLYRDQRRLVLAARTDLLPTSDEVKASLGYEPGLDIRTMASLRVLGYADVMVPRAGIGGAGSATADTGDDLAQRMRAVRLGAPARPRPLGEGPTVRPCVTEGGVAKAIELMRAAAARCDGVPAFYARYAEQMADLEAFAPWSVESWDKAVAACRYDAIPENDKTPFSPAGERDTADVAAPLAEFPEEARPEYLRKHRAEFMTAAEMAERLKSDPVAILPCGAFEMHGPHGLLGTDTFEAHSQAVVLARRWNGIVFPPVFYTYAGATERYPGSVSPSHYETARYVKAVARALFDAGFRRVAIMWVHGPGRSTEQMVVENLYRETGRVVFTPRAWLLRGPAMAETVGYGWGEDVWTLTALKLLGHPGVFVVNEPEDIGVRKLSHHTIVELTACGCRPTWYMGLPTHHLQVRSCVRSGDEDKLIPAMREAAAGYDDVPQLMDEFLGKTARPAGEAP